MKILALGNSFSQDCTTYLDRMTPLYVRNLHIGGCSLERHAKSLDEQIPDYVIHIQGHSTEDKQYVTANEIIASDAWDVITVQETSRTSGIYELHEPHLTRVLEHIRTLCPGARIVWNRTWSYTPESTHRSFVNYDHDSEKMHNAIIEASDRLTHEHGLPIIPTGDMIHLLRHVLPREDGYCRDGYHLHKIYGRYAAAYVWAKFFGAEINDFIPEDAEPETIAAIRRIIDEQM